MRREERNDNTFSTSIAKEFSEVIDRMGLVDLPLVGVDGPGPINETRPPGLG